MNAPPVVNENIESGEQQHEERSTPLCLEANRDHDACSQSKNGNNDTCNVPVALEDEADEQEDEEHTSSKLEVLAPVGLGDRGKTSK